MRVQVRAGWGSGRQTRLAGLWASGPVTGHFYRSVPSGAGHVGISVLVRQRCEGQPGADACKAGHEVSSFKEKQDLTRAHLGKVKAAGRLSWERYIPVFTQPSNSISSSSVMCIPTMRALRRFQGLLAAMVVRLLVCVWVCARLRMRTGAASGGAARFTSWETLAAGPRSAPRLLWGRGGPAAGSAGEGP